MYFVFVIIVILLYFYIQILHLSKEKKQKYFCFCAFLVILFVHLFKDNSSYPDLIRYENEFDGIATIPNIRDFFTLYFGFGGYFHEIGWSMLIFLCTRLTDDFTVFLKIISIGICTGYSFGIYKLSKSALFSFLFIMLYSTALPQSFYVLRQHLAFSMFFLGVPYLMKNDYKRFFICYFFILSIHYSSIILLPFVFFYKLGYKLFSFKRILFVILILLSFTYLLNQITYERYVGYAAESTGNLLGLLLTGSVFFAFILTRATKHVNDQYNSFIQSYLLYSFIVCLGCVGSNTGRLTNYFTFFLSITVPYIVQNQNNSIRLIVYSLFIVLSIIINMNSAWSYFNYKLIF